MRDLDREARNAIVAATVVQQPEGTRDLFFRVPEEPSAMARHRVLYVSNSHPALYVGGVEICSYQLFEAMRQSEDFEPIFLARSASPAHRFRRGTCFHAVDDDPNQILWFQERHDHLFLTSPDKEQYTVHFHELLRAYRPHVVHFQHTTGLGVDLIRQVKNSLPGTPIVYSLHEYLPICNARGFMRRTTGRELCRQASPMRCHECFTDIPPQRFFLRERFIKSQFRHVDLFLSPSRFLCRRYRDWGIPGDKIRFQENGRLLPDLAEDDLADVPNVGNFAFFGQLMEHKGILVLLRAMKMLLEAGDRSVRLFVNGANLDRESDDFRGEVQRLLDECPNVTFLGRYDHSELPARMRDVAWVVVPSLWWENSPLVIQEAFMYGRPVICTGIGALAEKVRDGVDGLQFRLEDAGDLASKLQHAASSPALWKRLRANVQPVYSMAEAVESHRSIYRSLLDRGGNRE